MAYKKNNNYNIDLDLPPIDIDNMEEAVFIDIDAINKDSSDESKILVKDLKKIYGNEEFMQNHPDYIKRLNIELESLRVLIKMRKSDEITHDVLIKAISLNSGNASLYASLVRIQETLIRIQTKMDETIKNLNSLMKNYQLELNFEESATDEVEEAQEAGIYKGAKAFINEMNEVNDDTLFMNEEDEDEDDLDENADEEY